MKKGDGCTLCVTVPKGSDVKMVIVTEEGTQNGGLYYPKRHCVCKTCRLWCDGEIDTACPWGSEYEHYESDFCSAWTE